MRADAYLPHVVENVPIGWMMPDGRLRHDVLGYVRQGVVRVIAGPERCHVWIDIRRPYHRPPAAISPESVDAR